jgi:hypothetical protein
VEHAPAAKRADDSFRHLTMLAARDRNGDQAITRVRRVNAATRDRIR